MNGVSGACATPALDGARCTLCGDEALPGRVLSVDAAGSTAEVTTDGVTHTVALDLVEGVAEGVTVLVHQGFVISVGGERQP